MELPYVDHYNENQHSSCLSSSSSEIRDNVVKECDNVISDLEFICQLL